MCPPRRTIGWPEVRSRGPSTAPARIASRRAVSPNPRPPHPGDATAAHEDAPRAFPPRVDDRRTADEEARHGRRDEGAGHKLGGEKRWGDPLAVTDHSGEATPPARGPG